MLIFIKMKTYAKKKREKRLKLMLKKEKEKLKKKKNWGTKKKKKAPPVVKAGPPSTSTRRESVISANESESKPLDEQSDFGMTQTSQFPEYNNEDLEGEGVEPPDIADDAIQEVNEDE